MVNETRIWTVKDVLNNWELVKETDSWTEDDGRDVLVKHDWLMNEEHIIYEE